MTGPMAARMAGPTSGAMTAPANGAMMAPASGAMTAPGNAAMNGPSNGARSGPRNGPRSGAVAPRNAAAAGPASGLATGPTAAPATGQMIDERERLARGSASLATEPVMRLRCPTCHAAFRGNFSRCMRDGAALVRTAEDPLIGTTLAERYVIEALVGEGAMGLVYRAHHARLSRLFALKLMFGDVAADPSMRLRFAQEADAASRMSHPNVVSVLDFGKTETGLLYLAMEFAEGETLAQILRREGPLAEARVVALARQMARGLGHAHRAGLVHRDFKPANVAATSGEDGSELVRILDFGLAIAEGDRIGRLTEHGLVVGTPIYISPEQARDQAVDHRADLFALGVVMYEMLAGKPPFEGTSHEIARANVTLAPPPIARRNPRVRVSPELEALVIKLMAKRASDRFQSAEEVIAALGQLGRRAVPLPAVAPVEEAEVRPAPRLRSPVQWLLAKSANLGWSWGRGPDGGGAARAPGGDALEVTSWRRTGSGAPGTAGAATSAATTIDAAPFGANVTSAATVIDGGPFQGGETAAGGLMPPGVVWDVGRDHQATQAMNPAALRRGYGVLRQIVGRRGMVAVAWFALATSGVVCSMMEGKRSAAGQSGSQLAMGTEVGEGGRAGVQQSAVTLVWMRAVTQQIRCAVDSMGAPPRAAGDRFEGKMGPARARRCPTVQNAVPIEAEPLWSTPARRAGTDRSRPSAPPSRQKSSKDSRAEGLPVVKPLVEPVVEPAPEPASPSPPAAAR
jgi:Protein kinase domain